LLVMTGRRQVGKSRLLTEFVERSKSPSLYMTVPASPAAADHMAAWVEAAVHANRPLPGAKDAFQTAPRDWDDAFAKLAAAGGLTPSVVVLDELARARVAEPRLDEILASHWQRALRRRPLLLVLVDGASDLRPDATMELGPFNPAECAHALGPRASPLDAFDAFLITGGNPRLVAGCARAARAAAQAAASPGRRATDVGAQANAVDYAHDQLRDENSDLVVMAQRFLSTELAESASAQTVLSVIGAEGVELTTFSRIVAGLPIDGIAAQTAATRALRLLADDKRIVEVDVPVGAPVNTKLRRYHVADLYLRFWHTFVRPRIVDITRGRPDIAIANFDARWPAWREAAIGPVVRHSLRRLALTMPVLTRVESVGGWWNRDGSRECRLVLAGDSAHPVVALGAVKWRADEPFTLADSRLLARARDIVPGASRARLVAVAPAGASPDADVDVVIDAQALLSAW
jgi:hypothetical protein